MEHWSLIYQISPLFHPLPSPFLILFKEPFKPEFADPDQDPDPGISGSWSDFKDTKSIIFKWKIYLRKVIGQKT